MTQSSRGRTVVLVIAVGIALGMTGAQAIGNSPNAPSQSAQPGQQVLSVQNGTQDQFEPNDDPQQATALQSGQTVTAAIENKGDLDWYSIQASSGQQVRIDLAAARDFQTKSGKPGQLGIRVYTPNGNVIPIGGNDYDAVNRSQGKSFSFTANQSGSYYIALASVVGTGSYKLRATVTGNGNANAQGRPISITIINVYVPGTTPTTTTTTTTTTYSTTSSTTSSSASTSPPVTTDGGSSTPVGTSGPVGDGTSGTVGGGDGTSGTVGGGNASA